MSYEIQHSLGLNSLCYLFCTRCRPGLACDEELSLQDSQGAKNLCASSSRLSLSPFLTRLSPYRPPFNAFASVSKTASPLHPPLLLRHYINLSFLLSRCSSTLDFHSELCRMGFWLLTSPAYSAPSLLSSPSSIPEMGIFTWTRTTSAPPCVSKWYNWWRHCRKDNWIIYFFPQSH